MNKRPTKMEVGEDSACPRLLHGLQNELHSCVSRIKKKATAAAVHNLRIAIRRLRALLHALDGAINPSLAAIARFELDGVMHALGPARDAYVRKQIALPILESLKNFPSRDSNRCMLMLNGESARATTALRLTVRSADWASCLTRINAALRRPRFFGLTKDDCSKFIAASLVKRLRRIERTLKHNLHSTGKLHHLRIEIKNARYLSEMYLLPADKDLPIAVHLREMQNTLGNLHDIIQLGDWLSSNSLRCKTHAQLPRKIKSLAVKYFDRYAKQRKLLRKAIANYLLADDSRRDLEHGQFQE